MTKGLEIEQVWNLLKKLLPSEFLNDTKVAVFQKCLEGKRYEVIAKELGYNNDYIFIDPITMMNGLVWKTLLVMSMQPSLKKQLPMNRHKAG